MSPGGELKKLFSNEKAMLEIAKQATNDQREKMGLTPLN